ncbi:hypothetical protein Tco_0312590 [Tanacetum coccineum]
MLRKCHGHGLTKGDIIQIFYHGLDEPTQGILDITAGGIFLYKSPNQAFQFLEDKVLFKLDWSLESKLNIIENLLLSPMESLKEEMHEMRKNYNNCGGDHASKNDDTPMCERHEANYIRSEDCYQNQDSHDSYSRQSHHDLNDSEKLLIELNNDVKNDLEHFKSCIHSMRTIHDKLFDRDDGKTIGVLPNKKSEIVNQEPQANTDLEKLMTKFLDGQRVTNMFFKNNVNDMIIKMKQNEKNCQTIFKNLESKIDEWEKSQNVSSEQTDRTDPPPPQAYTEQVNVVFAGSAKSMSEDPNQHLKEFLKIADSIDLNGASKEIKCMRLYKFSIHDQAINWLEHLPTGSISTWEDHFSFPRSVFPPGRTTKLRNDILMFQQNHSESLYEAWTPTSRVIDHSADGKLHDKSAKKSWEIIEGLALYENESWIDLRDLVKPIKAVSLPLDDSLSLKIKSNA